MYFHQNFELIFQKSLTPSPTPMRMYDLFNNQPTSNCADKPLIFATHK